ncbi:MAG: aminoglycoside phosphotransferase family protein [Desulfobulbus sp.]|nr:MAG: aminoglycoside phosphotransferase family protein [Desulfobulbus sp.]
MIPARHAALFFVALEDIAGIAPFGGGHVNDTFLLTLTTGEERILQRINPEVFPDPALVMRNLRLVTEHLRTGNSARADDAPPWQPLALYEGAGGDTYLAEDGAAWRLLNRIRGGHPRQAIGTAQQARELGRALGYFHRTLASLDSALLADTLPGFHVTPRYLARYDQVQTRTEDRAGQESLFCRQFIEQRRATASLLEMRRGELTSRIIHGDPKVANFLFDDEGERVISLIDLDTVKPGLLLHDLGDALRSCCNPTGETPADPERVFFAPDLFAAWLAGYRSEARALLSGEDLRLLIEAVALIAFELGLRFYTDHLEGNRYFKVTEPGQNLRRALTQFQLTRSIEHQRDKLTAIAATVAG